MADRIAITGIGIITAAGTGGEVHVQAFRNQQSNLGFSRLLNTIYRNELPVGEVPLNNDDLAVALGLPEGNNGYSRTALLALSAMQDLMAGIPEGLLQPGRFALINATTVGGMSSMEDIYDELVSPMGRPEHALYIPAIDCEHTTRTIAEHFAMDPLMATISTACSSSANALMFGARLIRRGVVRQAICGGSDALSRFTLNGFNSLKNVDRRFCRPFDAARNGLNLGEAAGYCLLEAETDARQRGAEISAYLTGYSNTNDAYHTTAPAPDGAGAEATMREALNVARVRPENVGYINAHGTATLNNDLAEGLAIQRLFGKQVRFSSTKPFTGHTLAAAGVIEAIFSVLALKHGFLIPALNFDTKMPELEIMPVTGLLQCRLKNVVSNSFGFGGSNVSLVFSEA